MVSNQNMSYSGSLQKASSSLEIPAIENQVSTTNATLLHSKDSFEKSGQTAIKLPTPPSAWLNPTSAYYEDYKKALSVPHALHEKLLEDNKDKIDFYQKGPIRVGYIRTEAPHYSHIETVKVGDYFDNLQALALRHRAVEHNRTGIEPDIRNPDISDVPSYQAQESVRNGDTDAIHKALQDLLQQGKIIKIPHGEPSPLPDNWHITSSTTSFPSELSADITIGRSESRMLTKAKLDANMSKDFFEEGPIRIYNHIQFLKDGEKEISVGARAGDYYKNLQHLALHFREIQSQKTPPLHEQGHKMIGLKTTTEKQVEGIQNGDLDAIHKTLHEMLDKRLEFHFPTKL